MIDKLSIYVGHMRPASAVLLNHSVTTLSLDRFDPIGSERERFIFVGVRGVPGIYFKCFKPFGVRTHTISEARLRTLDVVDINLNPSAYSNFRNFRAVVEYVLDDQYYTTGLPVTRLDLAVDLPVTMESAVRGIYWRDRSCFEDYNLESGQVTREYVVGRNPHSLAVYDLERKLRLRDLPVPCSPLTRFEMRLFKEHIPSSLRRMNSLDQIPRYAADVMDNIERPFDNVVLHQLSLPPMPERYEPPMRRYVDRDSARHMRQDQMRRENWTYVRGLMRHGKYHQLKAELSTPNSRWERYWNALEDNSTPLGPHLIRNFERYFAPENIQQARNSRGTWCMAA